MKNMLRICIEIALIFAGTNLSLAQWVKTGSGPTYVTSFAVNGTNLFAGAYNGVFLSSNNRTSWTPINITLTNTNVQALAVSGTNLFAGTSGGVFLSTNNGTSWTASGLAGNRINVLAVNGADLFAGTGHGVFLSTDNGTSWTAVNTGLPTNVRVSAFAASGTNLFIGTDAGIYRSTDNGTNWAASLLTNDGVSAFAIGGSNLFAAAGDSVLFSTDNGASWIVIKYGLSNGERYIFPGALAVSGTNLIAGTNAGIYLFTNSGTSWSAVDTGLATSYVPAIVILDTNLFAGTDGGVWKRPLSEMTAVGMLTTDLPTHFGLEQNYPNPFNPSTTISFNLPSKSFVSLKVFDALARQVSILLKDELAAGRHTRQWNAADLPSGMYFYRLQAGSFTETKKLLLLK